MLNQDQAMMSIRNIKMQVPVRSGLDLNPSTRVSPDADADADADVRCRRRREEEDSIQLQH